MVDKADRFYNIATEEFIVAGLDVDLGALRRDCQLLSEDKAHLDLGRPRLVHPVSPYGGGVMSSKYRPRFVT